MRKSRKNIKHGAKPAAKQENTVTPSGGISQTDWALWCLAGAVNVIIWFEPNRTPLVTVLGLLALFVFLLIPVLHLPFIAGTRPGRSRIASRVLVTALVGGGVSLYGLHVWPETKLGVLTTKERDGVVTILKGEAHPSPVRLMCPPNDESECAIAGQFISLFGMAGWPLTSQTVEREFNGSPHSGVYFVLHSTADVDYSKPEFRKPGVGVWTEMPPAYYTAKKVFDRLGIKTDVVVGTSFPEGVLGIYFGV